MLHYTKKLVLSTCVLSILFLGACGNDDCPEVVQSEAIKIEEAHKVRFPYTKIDSLVFRVEKSGTVDTVVLRKTNSGIRYFKTGDGFNRTTLCKVPFFNRYEIQFCDFGFKEKSHPDGLFFTNKAKGSSMVVRSSNNNAGLGYDSTGINHSFLDDLVGPNNERVLNDTVVFRGKVYNNATRGVKTPFGMTYIYQQDVGFIYIKNRNTAKTWILLPPN